VKLEVAVVPNSFKIMARYHCCVDGWTYRYVRNSKTVSEMSLENHGWPLEEDEVVWKTLGSHVSLVWFLWNVLIIHDRPFFR
jgi:hypothetical protein